MFYLMSHTKNNDELELGFADLETKVSLSSNSRRMTFHFGYILVLISSTRDVRKTLNIHIVNRKKCPDMS